MARLLFVDDHPLYRAGVRLSLERGLPEFQLNLATSAEEALALLETGLDIDLCLTDLKLPGRDGFWLLAQARQQWPTVARGVLCAEPAAETAKRARALGCMACLSKARDMDALVEAVCLLFAGESVFDVEGPPGPALSERRRRVLEMAAQGLSNKQIARELGITERTVKDHWSSIFGLLDVTSRVEAVSRAHQLRLLA